MARIAIVVLLGAAACARNPAPGDVPAPEPLRLCVRNATLGYGNIVAHAGPVRINVIPGQEACREVTDPGPGVRLEAATTGGGVSGPLSYAATLHRGNSACWRWSLTNSPSSAADLEPCR